jgi:hypothetical protein
MEQAQYRIQWRDLLLAMIQILLGQCLLTSKGKLNMNKDYIETRTRILLS